MSKNSKLTRTTTPEWYSNQTESPNYLAPTPVGSTSSYTSNQSATTQIKYIETSTQLGESISTYVQSSTIDYPFHLAVPRGAQAKIEQLAELSNICQNKALSTYKYTYCLHLVTLHCIRHDFAGCPINVESWAKKISVNNQKMAKIIHDLSRPDIGLLTKVSGYEKGVQSTKYITPEKTDLLEIVTFPQLSLGFQSKMIQKEQKSIQLSQDLSLYYNYLSNITIDISKLYSPPPYPMMVKFEKMITNNKYSASFDSDYATYCLMQLQGKAWRLSRPREHGRVHTNLTNLPRELRSYLRYEGKSFMEIDVRNSQPLIASILVKAYFEKQQLDKLPDDVIQYQKDCEDGKFYDYFMEINNIEQDQESRKDFKKVFFSKVFFSKVTNLANPLKDQFMERYPSCYEAICSIKGGLNSNDYNQFAITLQCKEAELIFDEVNMSLLKMKIPTFNIYDSILCLPEHQRIVEEMILSAFKSVGILPKLNQSHYSGESE